MVKKTLQALFYLVILFNCASHGFRIMHCNENASNTTICHTMADNMRGNLTLLNFVYKPASTKLDNLVAITSIHNRTAIFDPEEKGKVFNKNNIKNCQYMHERLYIKHDLSHPHFS